MNRTEIIEFMRDTAPVDSPKLSVFGKKVFQMLNWLLTEDKQLQAENKQLKGALNITITSLEKLLNTEKQEKLNAELMKVLTNP